MKQAQLNSETITFIQTKPENDAKLRKCLFQTGKRTLSNYNNKNHKHYVGKDVEVYYLKVRKDGKSFYKIGVSLNLERRILALQTENVEIILLARTSFNGIEAFEYEKGVLYTFKDFRLKVTAGILTSGNSELFTFNIFNIKNSS